jgi:hypothetical protein
MSEKPPRRRKKEEKTPEPEHNPALEQLIDQAPKGSVSEIKQEIQSEQSGKRIISRENDAHLQSQLGKFNTLNFKPGFSPEELFNETPLTKETVSDTQLETVLAKIAKEEKLTGAKVLNYLNDMGGTNAPSEAIEKIMTVASERLDNDVFNKLKTIVFEGQTLRVEKSEVIPPVELKQVGNEEASSNVKNVEVPPTSTNIPPEVFNTFVHTGEVSDRVLEGIAGKIIKKEDLSFEEIAIYREDTEKIEGILRKTESELSKENIVAANPEIQEAAPENLPGRSPEELKDFATTFLAGEEGKNNTLSQESTAGLPGRDEEGNFNSEMIRRAIKANQSVGVRIRRSSGDVEDGWFLMDGDTNHVVAAKDVGKGRIITKIVPLEEVNDLNRIESHPVSVPEASIPTKKESATDSVRAQNIRQRIEELNHEAAGHTSGYARTGEEIQTEVLALEAELKNLERAGKTTEGAPAPEEESVQMTSEGASFSDAQKERVSKEFGEQSEGTPKEWREKLRSLVLGEKNSEGKREHVESSKEYLAKRSEELGEKAKEYGSIVAGIIGNKIEQYNKLNWKTKLAITGALMAGTAFSGGVLATGFAAALWGQRAVGAIGMGMNKRKKLDAEIAANPEHRLAGKSESRKNIEVALWSAAYMAATSFVVHEGVEGLKAVADSEWLANMLEHYPAQSDISASGPETLTPGLTLTPEEVEALAPSTDALETLAPIPDMPEASTPSPYADSDVQEHIDKAREAIERMQKLTEEQAKILNTMPDGSETPGISSAEVPLDQMHTVQELGPTLFAEAKGDDQLRILAENSLKHLTPNEQAVLDNHIASFTPRERYFFDQYTNDLSSKLNAPETSLPEQSSLETPVVPEQSAGTSPEGKIGSDRMFDAQDRMEQGLPSGENGQFRGLEHPDGMSGVEKAMQYPGTDVFPKPPEEKGFFEKLFGSSDENPTEVVDQLIIDSVSATEPHIYAHADGHLFAYGGSIEEKIETIQKFLTENPDKIVYGTDDSGNYRIPWSLYEGHALPGEPVRTGGFLGFFSSFMDAPRPEEFVKKIK